MRCVCLSVASRFAAHYVRPLDASIATIAAISGTRASRGGVCFYLAFADEIAGRFGETAGRKFDAPPRSRTTQRPDDYRDERRQTRRAVEGRIGTPIASRFPGQTPLTRRSSIHARRERRLAAPLRYHSPVLTFAAIFHSSPRHAAPQRRLRRGSVSRKQTLSNLRCQRLARHARGYISLTPHGTT